MKYTTDTVHHAHQFDSLEQQKESVSLGMWLFLLTEVMFFGGMFLGYTVYRMLFPGAFHDGSHHLNILLGSINTVVLIGSSLTMAFAVMAAKLRKKEMLMTFIILTIMLGAVFLGIKAVEYTQKFQEGHVPGPNFAYEHFDHKETVIFYSFYFAMTGMHAVHMVIGMIIMLVMLPFAASGRLTRGNEGPVEVLGLYWHFVDIVWIFLFPLLYLIGRH